MKVVYFTSEFPGQTHIFFWREFNELRRIGVDAHLVSTRTPPIEIQSHSWSAYARKNTVYLYPFSAIDCWNALITPFSLPRSVWKSLISVFFGPSDLSLRDKVSLFAQLIMATKLARLILYQKFDHVHCTTCAATANIAMFCRILLGTSYSLSLLGPRLETYGPNQSNKWRHASFGLFQSQKLMLEAHQTIPDSIPKLHALAPVGVDTEVVKRTRPYEAWRAGSTCQLYCCGRLNPIKGHEYVIRAVKILRERGYSVQLDIGGEDIEGGRGYRRVVEREILINQLESSVTLLGAVSEEQNIRSYELAHVYVMGSLDEAAGAVAAMEAMAMEVPVVMPDAGATSELISNGLEGILVEKGNPLALADAIEQLLNDPDRAVRMGRSGRRKVLDRFNHHISASAIAGFLAAIDQAGSVHSSNLSRGDTAA